MRMTIKLPETKDTLWGPPAQVPAYLRYSDTPYAPFSKGDKLGKVADWGADLTKEGKDQKRAYHGRGFRDPYHAYGASSTSFFTSEETDSTWTFSVVDSSIKTVPKQAKQGNAVLKIRGRQQSARPSQGPPGSQSFWRNNPQRMNQQGQYGRGGFRRGAWGLNDKDRNREPSIVVGEDWRLIQTNGFKEFQKLSYDVSSGKTVEEHGFVQYFDKSLDRLYEPKRLRPIDRQVFNVTTSEDPVILDLASKNKAKLFATDAIVALLMCSTKTKNPWDLVVNKKDGQIFLDKRIGGPLDFLSVDENAQNPPSESAENKIDSASQLALEATYINQNFAANALTSDKFEFGKPSPFLPDDQGPPILAKGYRYREFNLEANPEASPIPLIVRSEIDAAVVGQDSNPSFISVRALNEYGGNKSLEWKDRLSKQHGAIVLAEMRNNRSKMSQWACQAIIAGVESLKIGFVSRINSKDKTQHEIVRVLSYDPITFANQLDIQLSNCWGIVKSIYNIFAALEDGQYVVMRDPNSPALKIYQVPHPVM